MEEKLKEMAGSLRDYIIYMRVMLRVKGDVRLYKGVMAVAEAFKDARMLGSLIEPDKAVENLGIGLTFKDVEPYLKDIESLFLVTDKDIANLATILYGKNGDSSCGSEI
jgi:hypothetical protein